MIVDVWTFHKQPSIQILPFFQVYVAVWIGFLDGIPSGKLVNSLWPIEAICNIDVGQHWLM